MARVLLHDHLGRTLRTYEPSFFSSGFINDTQAGLVELLSETRGKLEPADHHKLYEAAYFADGPIVEVGRLAGKSTTILALGARDAGHDHPIYSIEYAPNLLASAEATLRQFGVLDRVTLIQGDSAVQLGRICTPFDVVFIDGDHSYEGVHRDAMALRGRLSDNAVVMFHDYFHPANETGEYGVRTAVDELATSLALHAQGRFGGIALYVRGAAITAA